MTRVEKTVDLHRNGGLTCSQAILTAYGEPYGIDSDKARLLGRSLAGGIGGQGGTCGYVAAAMLILAHANNHNDEATSRKATHPIVMEFFRRLAEKQDTTICKEILGANLSTDEGLKKALNGKLFEKFCYGKNGIGQDVAEILEELL